MSKLEDMLIDQSTSIKEAMRIIDRAGVRMALIVDDNQKLKGIVTDGDIRRGIIKGAGNEDEVSTVMNKAPLTTKENVPHQDVLDLLKTNKVLGIPVLSEKTPGVIGSTTIGFPLNSPVEVSPGSLSRPLETATSIFLGLSIFFSDEVFSTTEIFSFSSRG